MGELLEAVEFEHQPLVDGFVSWFIWIPKACPLGVEVYLLPSMEWQCQEEAVVCVCEVWSEGSVGEKGL